jgi:protoporphyrin/coproporphyrin ferrochelatase
MGNMPAYDAFLLLSFGGPEGPDDVLPFLQNVTRGRGVPPERLAEVAEHYHAYGGVSPINAQNRELLAAIGAAFAEGGVDLPMYWGNRNWHPYIEDTVRQMQADGVTHALAFVTSAYGSYSACRQYLDDIDRAVAAVSASDPGHGASEHGASEHGVSNHSVSNHSAPRIDKLRPYFNHPGFIEPYAAAVADALAGLPAAAQASPRLVFTAHSVPDGMAASSGSASAGTAVPAVGGGRYVVELKEAARLITQRLADERPGSEPLPFDLVFQSRSGPPSVPWLEPDVNDHLAALAKGALTTGEPVDVPSGVVVVPVGFVSDHMEVVHDLDVEAAQTAASLGLPFARAKAPGPTPRFAEMVRELVQERLSGAEPQALGSLGLGAFAGGADGCPADCCRYAPKRPSRPA